MPTTVRSHAKINLGLYIGAPRSDGFHSLVTVYQTLEMHDLVTVSAYPATATSIQITSNDRRVPADNGNTAWKMVERALQVLDLAADVSIHIDKRLPVQGGLGAGSANAVAALIGLEKEIGLGAPGPSHLGTWDSQSRSDLESLISACISDLDFPGENWPSRRLELAAQVGSDVPLFLIGGTVLGLDRGQEVYPLPDIETIWCVLATPSIGVSTPQAFREWDALCGAEGLTAEASTDKLKQLSRAYASAFAEAIPEGRRAGSSGVPPVGGDLAGPPGSALVRTGITSWIANDFERVVFRQHPSLAEIKRLLAAAESPEAALHASLSGSGSALFGLYLAREHAEAACARLQAAGVQGTLTRTMPRAEYWGQMARVGGM